MLVAALITAYLAALILHEAAHAAAARLVGARILEIRLRLFSGAVITAPPGGTHWKRRLALIIAAGPVSSLGLCLTAIAIWHSLPSHTPLATWLLSFGVLSGAISLVSGLPYRTTSLTDGDKIELLFAKDARAVRWQACVQIDEANRRGLRPRQWPAHLVQPLTTVRDGSVTDLQAILWAYYVALDTGNLARAANLIESARVWTERADVAVRDLLSREAHWLAVVSGNGVGGRDPDETASADPATGIEIAKADWAGITTVRRSDAGTPRMSADQQEEKPPG